MSTSWPWNLQLREIRSDLVQVKTNYFGVLTLTHPVFKDAIKLVEDAGYKVVLSSSNKKVAFYCAVTKPKEGRLRVLYFRVEPRTTQLLKSE